MAAKLIEIGKNLTFKIAPLTIAPTTGVITVGTDITLTGKTRRAAVRLTRDVERVDSLDYLVANNVYLGDDWQLELSAIKFKGGTNPNPLMETFLAGAYAQITVLTTVKSFTFQGILNTGGFDVGGPGGIDDGVTLIPIDTGAANPTVATLP